MRENKQRMNTILAFRRTTVETIPPCGLVFRKVKAGLNPLQAFDQTTSYVRRKGRRRGVGGAHHRGVCFAGTRADPCHRTGISSTENNLNFNHILEPLKCFGGGGGVGWGGAAWRPSGNWLTVYVGTLSIRICISKYTKADICNRIRGFYS